MNVPRALLLTGAAGVAGLINSVAGGGTLLSFPAAMAAGLGSAVANATNCVALAPGSFAAAWAQRGPLRERAPIALSLLVPAVGGGLLGAWLLRHSSQRFFDTIVPLLIFIATGLLGFQDWRASRPHSLHGSPVRAAAGTVPGRPEGKRWWLILFCQLLVGIYGGYFGAGMGILMMAFLSLIPELSTHQTNAIKNMLAAGINVTATIYFVGAGLVDGPAAGFMAVGALGGGMAGGRLANRLSGRAIRRMVIVIGLALGIWFTWRRR